MSALNPPKQKGRPLIFNAAMVRALLEGRKTQTRRIIKPEIDTDLLTVKQPAHSPFQGTDGIWRWMSGVVSRGENDRRCPYGVAGDRLWCRETFALHDNREPPIIYYRADDPQKYESDGAWKPSIHMPRWASRITLEITKVRVERLNSISEEDAKDEGAGCWREGEFPQWDGDPDEYRKRFASLWDSINGVGAWNRNDWVWVVEFCRVDSTKSDTASGSLKESEVAPPSSSQAENKGT